MGGEDGIATYGLTGPMYTGKAVVNITSHIQIHLGFNSTSFWMCVYEVCTQYYICTYLRNFVTISLEQQWDP